MSNSSRGRVASLKVVILIVR